MYNRCVYLQKFVFETKLFFTVIHVEQVTKKPIRIAFQHSLMQHRSMSPNKEKSLQTLRTENRVASIFARTGTSM
jgi:hypothetical protein